MIKDVNIITDNLYKMENDATSIFFSAEDDLSAIAHYYLILSKLASLTKVQPQEEIELSKPAQWVEIPHGEVRKGMIFR